MKSIYVFFVLVAISLVGFVGCDSCNKKQSSQDQQISEQQLAEISSKAAEAAEKKVQSILSQKDKELQAEKEKNRKLEKLAVASKTPKLHPQDASSKSEPKQTQTTPKQNEDGKNTADREQGLSTEVRAENSENNLLKIKLNQEYNGSDSWRLSSNLPSSELCGSGMCLSSRVFHNVPGINSVLYEGEYSFIIYFPDIETIPLTQTKQKLKSFLIKDLGDRFKIKFIGSW